MYEAEWCNRIPKECTVEMIIKEVVTNYLVYYNYASKEQCTEAMNKTEDVLQLLIDSVTENKVEHSSTMNERKLRYFDEEMKKLGREIENTSRGNIICDDDIAGMLHRIEKEKRRDPTIEPTDRLCPTRGMMEKIASNHQKKQAETVNAKRAQYDKPVLEVGDIGTMKVLGYTRAATDYVWLPIMVTFV